MNQRYAKRFSLLHRGMLEIVGISGFRLVFIHIGNFHQDTKGCPLTGHYWDFKNGDYEVLQSELSYLKVYQALSKALQNGIHHILVVNKLRKGASDHAA